MKRLASGLLALAACSLGKTDAPTGIPAPVAAITVGGAVTGSFSSIPVVVVCDDPSTPGCVLTITATTSAPIITADLFFAGAPMTGTFTAGDAGAHAAIDYTETSTPGSNHWRASRGTVTANSGSYTLVVSSVSDPVVQNGRHVYVAHATLDATLNAVG